MRKLIHSLPEKSVDAVGAVVTAVVGLPLLGDNEIADIVGWTLEEGPPVGSAVRGARNGPIEGFPVGGIVTETLEGLLVGIADGSNCTAVGITDGIVLVGIELGFAEGGREVDAVGILVAVLGFEDGILLALGNVDGDFEGEVLGFTDIGFAEGIREDDADRILVGACAVSG